jgi:hypothetical protein
MVASAQTELRLDYFQRVMDQIWQQYQNDLIWALKESMAG